MSKFLAGLADCLTIVIQGAVAILAGGSVAWWLGTSWWARIAAATAALAAFLVADSLAWKDAPDG